MQRFRSVVVITFASHAKGPQFETGRKQAVAAGVLETDSATRCNAGEVGFCKGRNLQFNDNPSASLTHVRPPEDSLRALVSLLCAL